MKVYLIGATSPTEFQEVSQRFELAGHDAMLPLGAVELRVQIAMLIACDAVCLLDGWWISREGMCLQTVAAWLRMKVFDEHAQKMPTSSLKG